MSPTEQKEEALTIEEEANQECWESRKKLRVSIIDPEAGHCLFHVMPKSSSIKKYILLGLKFF